MKAGRFWLSEGEGSVQDAGQIVQFQALRIAGTGTGRAGRLCCFADDKPACNAAVGNRRITI
ncbi:hypothetical protein NBZ79_07745 [Sneathiella marina]|uniref:Uncharacterized protein n=1 Tax=Sneathiella marina TaxID=2950108 RepID=A0ABY4WAC5_9PROT|nr:hypothetical protein [Sneathiella marina]USG62867.1 hypothetical protein NBZ79_07745 [Sneathiella marina]